MSGTGVNFNVYVDKETGEKLQRLAKRRCTSRNALVREALARLLEEENVPAWPAAVMEFQGVAGARPFEDSREILEPPARDPFA
jgi:predicted transcriptional regulator